MDEDRLPGPKEADPAEPPEQPIDAQRRAALKVAATLGLAATAAAESLLGIEPAAAQSTLCDPRPYHSSLAVGRMVALVGNALSTRNALVSDLQSKGVNTSPALANLPAGVDADREAVARLVALARGYGYAVQVLGVNSSTGAVDLSITLPSAINLLQAAHDRPT
jgi:hypothetical protein